MVRRLRADDEHPRYVVAVVIDQAGYGAAAAAPVARQIFTYLTNHPVGSAGPASSGERSLIGLDAHRAPYAALGHRLEAEILG